MKTQLKINEVEHWECSNCDNQLTHIDPEDDTNANHDTIFEISRSNMTLDVIETTTNTEIFTNIEEDTQERNVKMQQFLCSDCFLKVLQESPTLGKLFINEEKDSYIW